MAINFRALFRFMLPGNYTAEGTDGEKVLYSLALIKDAFLQMARERLNARFPSRQGESAIALTGADRSLIRGRTETLAHYATRLQAWRTPRTHRVRGSGWAALEQISEYFGGGIGMYTEQGNHLQFIRTGDDEEVTATNPDWDWDSLTNPNSEAEWARAWFVLEGSTLIADNPDFGDPDLWGGSVGDDDYAVGHTGVSAAQVQKIRSLFRGRAWKPAGTRAMWLMLSPNDTIPEPNGEWGRWAKDDGGGNAVSARSADFRYWALDPKAQRYAGDPAIYWVSTTMPDASTYAGDPDSYPADAQAPDGKVIAGNPDKFPEYAILLDDGSVP